jgi:predicted AAA+ superfamily ATPase
MRKINSGFAELIKWVEIVRDVLTGLAERRLGEVVEARLAEEPVVVLNGPRTVGKSTLLSELARRSGRTVIDCDDLATRAAGRSDPARFVESDRPVLIDEYQHVPELLDAIKAQLNRDLRPGRYVLAGSTRYATLPEAAQALTGRATSGGMPVALRRPHGRSRSRWYSNYVDLVINKDVLDISRVRQREMLPRLLGQLAARSGQVLNMAAISGTVVLEKSTTENYTKLLEAVFLIYRLPAWGTTLGSRVTKHPKVHLINSGVMAWLLSLTPEKIAQDAPAALTEYGHLIETFAVEEILKQASWSEAPVTAGHFRRSRRRSRPRARTRRRPGHRRRGQGRLSDQQRRLPRPPPAPRAPRPAA